MSLLEKLAELANELDAKGYYDEATLVDNVIKEAAEVNMADSHHPPPKEVPPPKIETGPVPPAGSSLPKKKERPVPTIPGSAPSMNSMAPQNAEDMANDHVKEDKKPSSHLPKVHDPKTASMYANDGAFAAVKKIKEQLDKLSAEEAKEAHKLLKALLHKMEEQKADAPQPKSPAPFKKPEEKSKDIPPVETKPNQPNPPLSPPKKDLGP